MGEAPRRTVAGINGLASYSKSGNTWVRLMLASCFSEIDAPHDINRLGVTNSIASACVLFDEIPGQSSSDLTSAEMLPLRDHVYRYIAQRAKGPVWMKVHDAQVRNNGKNWLFPPEAHDSRTFLSQRPGQ